MNYPNTRRSDFHEIIHNEVIHDPYRWLEEIDGPETQKWIEVQNELTSSLIGQSPARQRIQQRLEMLWNYEKFGVPDKHNGRYFFLRNDGLQNQSVLYWTEDLGAEPKLLIDPNLIAEDGTAAMTFWSVSPDGRWLAYGIAKAGSDWTEWRIRSVDTGLDLEDHLHWVKFSGASWTKDNQGFYYSRYDAPEQGGTYKGANYYQKLYYHRLGTVQADDRLIYERADQKEWGFGGKVSDDGRYLVVNVWQGTLRKNGIFYVDLEQDPGRVHELLNEFDALYSFLGNAGSLFYFSTDLEAPNGRVIAIDIRKPERNAWLEIIPESANSLQSASLVGGKFFLVTLKDAYSEVSVCSQDGQVENSIPLPGIGSVVGFRGEQQDGETFFFYTSFTDPGTVYRYDLALQQVEMVMQPKLRFEAADYLTEQVFYPSKDGTQVPMFISHRRDVQPSPETPCYLYGYGGFNLAQTPLFKVGELAWMEAGGIYAVANLRGGSEYGSAWHEAGMKEHKQNVFDDFIAAAEWLITQGYTSTPRLAIGGRSNGGLLVGACLTQRPELYGAAVPVVGVMDMLRFHKFTIGWAWVSDYGSPDNPEDFRYIRAYSPYHNIKPGKVYPPTLVLTGDHDDRVFPAHSYKFAAALQAAQAGEAPILLRIDVQTGHGMGKPTAKLIAESTDMWTFIFQQLGIAAV